MRRNGNEQPLSEINITPLTDVMLVLLIIFMISSPVLLARGLVIHLPQVTEPPVLEDKDHTLYIAADGSIRLDGSACTIGQLPDAFQQIVRETDLQHEAINLFIWADKDVTYGVITQVMDAATQSGIEKIGLVQDVLTAPPAAPPTPQPETPPTGEIAAPEPGLAPGGV
jgi:biopolymer transport protein TolR